MCLWSVKWNGYNRFKFSINITRLLRVGTMIFATVNTIVISLATDSSKCVYCHTALGQLPPPPRSDNETVTGLNQEVWWLGVDGGRRSETLAGDLTKETRNTAYAVHRLMSYYRTKVLSVWCIHRVPSECLQLRYNKSHTCHPSLSYLSNAGVY